MSRNARGFTLIELMIVVAVIAILATIAFSLYLDYTAKTKISNAVGSIAGERIKIGENWTSGKTGLALCDGVAIDARLNCTSGAVMVGDEMTMSASDTQVRIVPLFPTGPSGRLSWECTVIASPVPAFIGDYCDQLSR